MKSDIGPKSKTKKEMYRAVRNVVGVKCEICGKYQAVVECDECERMVCNLCCEDDYTGIDGDEPLILCLDCANLGDEWR